MDGLASPGSTPGAQQTAAHPASCANCGAVLVGRFCAQCGQSSESLERPARELLEHVLEGLIDFDARGPRSLRLLLFRPGRLTADYLSGQRVRFVPPFRLYLFATLVFFFLLSITETAIVQFVDDVRPLGRGTTMRLFAPLAPNGPSTTPIQIVEDSGPAPDWLKRRIEKFDQALADPRRLNERLSDLLPKMMFALMPIFAVLLAAFSPIRGRFLIDHVIFSLHFHSFAFFLGAAMVLARPALPEGVANSVFFLISAGYLVIAMRTVYPSSWTRIALRASFLVGSYGVVLLAALFVLLALGIGGA